MHLPINGREAAFAIKYEQFVNIDPSLVKFKAQIGRISIENNATNLYRSSSEKDANLNIFHLVLY